MSLRNLSIAPRAALGFGLVALLVLLLGAFSLLQMSEMRKQSEASRSALAAKYDGAGGGQPGHPASACRDAAADAQS